MTWTRLADVRARLRKHWENGRFLRSWAEGAQWERLSIPLRGPAAAELAARFDDVRAWVRDWSDAEQRVRAFRLELRSVGTRSVGTNEIPARLVVDGYDGLWRLLDVRREVRRFAELRDATSDEQIVEWMNAHPMRVLAVAEEWPQMVDTLAWLQAARGGDIYLRQVPVPGVDTKFIEAHRALLADLLDRLLPPDSIDTSVSRSQFALRYGFATRPAYVRFRLLGDATGPVPGVREMMLRTTDFSRVAPTVGTVFIVENEVTYLAFPDVPDSMVIFGGGYTLASIAALPWLADRLVRYWGDLDTHGFAILNQLRVQLPAVDSMLMDRATLLEHRELWVTEPSKVTSVLPGLRPDEDHLYRDLVEDVYGAAIRLEQERVNFRSLTTALAADGRI